MDSRLRWLAGAGRAALLLALALSFAFILDVFQSEHSFRTWLFTRLLPIWCSAFLFGLSSLVGGHRIVAALMGDTLEPREHWPLAFSTGVLCFFLGCFIAGVMGLFGSAAFFFGLPLVLLCIGWPSFVTRVAREWADGRWRLPRLSPLEVLTLGAVAIALFFVYLPGLEPDNISADATWYHVPNAEHDMAAGRIGALAEGRLYGVFPQLATVVDVWALHLPFSALWDRLVLIEQLEFLTLVGTLAALPALCRALYPGRLEGAVLPVAAFFLFPSIFAYDTGLLAGADHFCALFAAPAWLALLRFWPRLEWRAGVLLALQVAGLILTKYVAAPEAAVLGAAVGLRAAWLTARAPVGVRVSIGIKGPFVCGAALLAATSSLWLKNWVFYGSPTYPFLSEVFAPTVWSADSPELLRQFAYLPFSHGARLELALRGALQALYDFSFNPRYSWGFSGRTPTVGSVFTALLLPLPFLGAGRRLWGIVLGIEAAVFGWYLTAFENRYLLVLIPWAAAATAALVALAWKRGAAAKVLVAAVLGVQVVGAADLPFHPRGDVPALSGPAKALQFIGSDHRGKVRNYERFTLWQDVGDSLPKGAKVLLHQTYDTVGLQRETVMDLSHHQFGFRYGRLGSLAAIDDKLKSMGVTHVGWPGRHPGYDSVAGELLFHAYLHALPSRDVHGITVAAVAEPRPKPHGEVVQYVGCDTRYRTGLYHLADLATPQAANRGLPPPLMVEWPLPFEPGIAAQRAQWLVVEAACAQNVDTQDFTLLTRVDGWEMDLYQRLE